MRAGFGDAPVREKEPAKKKKKEKKESQMSGFDTPWKDAQEDQLKADHGEKWIIVSKIFAGMKAKSPEQMMRARFSALKAKDCLFLGWTEWQMGADKDERAKLWEVQLGLREKGFLDAPIGENEMALREPVKFEVINADKKEVEFKITCANGKVLHETSTFDEDPNFGYIFSGTSSFSKWS